MFLQLSLDCLECLKKQEVTWDVSLTSFFFCCLAYSIAKKIHHSLYCWAAREKIVPFLKQWTFIRYCWYEFMWWKRHESYYNTFLCFHKEERAVDVCYLKGKKQCYVLTWCTPPKCIVYLHFTSVKKYLQECHSS